jgi:hypothetical protein
MFNVMVEVVFFLVVIVKIFLLIFYGIHTHLHTLTRSNNKTTTAIIITTTTQYQDHLYNFYVLKLFVFTRTNFFHSSLILSRKKKNAKPTKNIFYIKTRIIFSSTTHILPYMNTTLFFNFFFSPLFSHPY